MMYESDTYALNVAPPAAIVNNGSVTCNVIDTVGYQYLQVYLILGAIDHAMATLELQESDTKASATSLTSGANITGTVFGTDANDTGSTSVLPTTTDANGIFKFEIDLRGRKRYILPVVTIGNGVAGAYTTVLALLSRGQNMTGTASGKNCNQLMRTN